MNDFIAHSFRILELKPGASPEEIKKAYRDLVKVWHPDRFGNDTELHHKAQEKLKEINAAYEILVDIKAGKPSAGQGNQNTRSEVRKLQVDRFVYYDQFCDEVVAPSQLSNSEWGKTKPTHEWVKVMDNFAKMFRAVEYLLSDTTQFAHQPSVVTHTDFALRKIYLNRAAPLNMKSALMPLGIIFIRDLLNGIPKGHTEEARLALKSAGWNGGAVFEDANYLMSELVLSNRAAEYFFDNTMNKRSELSATWSNFWTPVKTALKLKHNKHGMHNLDDWGIMIGYNMKNIPIGGYSFGFGRGST